MRRSKYVNEPLRLIEKFLLLIFCSLLLSCASEHKKKDIPPKTATNAVVEPKTTKESRISEQPTTKKAILKSSKHKPILIQPNNRKSGDNEISQVSTIQGNVIVKKGRLGGSTDKLLLNDKIMFDPPGEFLEIISLVRFQDEDVILLSNQKQGTAYTFKSTYALRLKKNEKPKVEEFGEGIPSESASDTYNKRIVTGSDSVSFVGDLYKGKKEVCAISQHLPINCSNQDVRITQLSYQDCNRAIELIKTCSKHYEAVTEFDWMMFSNADSHTLNYLAYSTTGLNLKKFEIYCIKATQTKKIPAEDTKLRAEICSGATKNQWKND